MNNFNVLIKEIDGIVILETSGYLNGDAGTYILEICQTHIATGKSKYLINMSGTKIVNSIGVSLLIDVIEQLQEINGRLGFYNLAPIVHKTFVIMGLNKYSTMFESELDAIKGFQ